MHGLTGGGWKRSVGQGRSERCPRETPGTGAETYRRATSPRQPPTLHRVREACHDAERRSGLRPTAPADRTAARRATPAAAEQAVRRGCAEPPRGTLRREVCTAAAAADSGQEFFARLRAAGVLVRERHSTVNPGEVTGYAVGLPGHTARNGGVVWYGGGKLAAD